MYIHEVHLFNTLPSDVPIDQSSTFEFFIEIIQQFITLVDHPFYFQRGKIHHSIEIEKEKLHIVLNCNKSCRLAFCHQMELNMPIPRNMPMAIFFYICALSGFNVFFVHPK